MSSGYPSLTIRTGKLPGIDPSIIEREFQNQQALIFRQTGVIVPLIGFRQAEGLEERNCQFLIEDRCVMSFTILESNEFWVPVQFADISKLGPGSRLQAREHVLPGFEPQGSIIKGDEAARELWQKDGYRTATGAEYVNAVVFDIIMAHLLEFLVPALVDYYLTRLAIRVPALISIVRQRFTLEELTSALGSKLQSLGSIRNLTAILEQLLAEQAIRA